jgi:hypothetical protein
MFLGEEIILGNTKFHENPYSGTGVIPSGRTDGWAGMKLIVALRNFENPLT